MKFIDANNLVTAHNKGVFKLSNQLSNFPKNCGMKRGKTEIRMFHG